jgi:hypothetical protein
MTLAQAFVLILAVESAVVLGLLYAIYTTRQLGRLEAFEQWADMFFDCATHLVTNPQTPPIALRLLEQLNEFIDREGVAWAICRLYEGKPEIPAAPIDPNPELEAFMDNNPAASVVYFHAMRAAFMAMTYTSTRWGPKAREALAQRYKEVFDSVVPKPSVVAKDVTALGTLVNAAPAPA